MNAPQLAVGFLLGDWFAGLQLVMNCIANMLLSRDIRKCFVQLEIGGFPQANFFGCRLHDMPSHFKLYYFILKF